MKVKDLVEQIISYSHNEDSPETNLMAKALTWLNSAYHELLQENLVYLKHKMIKYETLTLQDFACELPEDFYLLEKIILDDGTRITKIDRKHYDIELNKIYINNHPEVKSIDVFYIPQFQNLKLEDSLNILHISPNQVDNLIWGALVWSGIYERALHTQSELNLFEKKWNQTKQNFKITLSTYSNQVLRTQPYRFLN